MGRRVPLIDEDRLEESIDVLEKASFKALHASVASAQRVLYLHQPPLPLLSNGGYSSGHHGGRAPGSSGAHAKARTHDAPP